MRPLTVGWILLAFVASSGPAWAGERLTFSLNYIAGGDHAPLYFARKEGWFQAAGLDVAILQTQGSAAALQQVAAGKSQAGIVDMANVLIGRGKGITTSLAVMNIYANSPYGIYWLKSAGITSPKDLAGRKIGTPPGDAARNLWVPLANKIGIHPESVSWVNINASAKLAALQSRAIDATTTFYTSYYLYQRELGGDLGYAAWRDFGINPYSNSVVFNTDYAVAHPEVVKSFVAVLQRAYVACVVDPQPCIDALIEENTALKRDDMLSAWDATVTLMSDKEANGAFGYMDPLRMKNDYELLDKYFGFQAKFPVEDTYTNRFLNPQIKLQTTK